MSCVKIYEKSNTNNFGLEQFEISIEEFKSITEVLEIQDSFRRSNIMCDVILLADDGVQIPAHKVILSSSSPFFFSLFTSGFKEKNEQIISIKEIDSDILKTIIKYIYTFKLDVTETNIKKLLKALHFFDLEKGMDKCCEFIGNIINLANCLHFMKFAKLFSYEKLYDLSFSYVLENFFKIEASTLFKLSYEEIRTFISNNYLVTESEEQVFKFILNWIKHDEENRNVCLPQLMKHIRLPLVSRKFFLDVFNEPLLRLHNESLILTIEAMMVHLMSMNLKHFTNFDGIELSVRGRKRIPKHLSKPDVILAIDNDYNDNQVSYIDIKSAYSDWVPGFKFLIPPNRCSKIVALENGILFSIGGATRNNVSINDVFILDLSYVCKKWIQTTSMIFSRKDFAICIHTKCIYAIGGVGADGQTLDTIEVFDINTKKWSILCLMEKPRSHCSAIYHDNILYIIGGKSVNSEHLLIVECFNELSLTWTNFVPSLPEWCIHNTNVAIFNNTLYIFGGNGKKYHNELGAINTVFTCNLKNGTGWSYLSLLDKRQNASIALIDDKIYIFGGCTSDIDIVDTTEIFDPRQSKCDVHCSNLNSKGRNVITFNKQLMNLLDLGI